MIERLAVVRVVPQRPREVLRCVRETIDRQIAAHVRTVGFLVTFSSA